MEDNSCVMYVDIALFLGQYLDIVLVAGKYKIFCPALTFYPPMQSVTYIHSYDTKFCLR